MKLRDCANFSEGFLRIMREKGIETKLSYRLAKIQRKCENELSALQVAMKPLIEQYGIADEKDVETLKPEAKAILKEKQSELMEQEVKFDFDPLPVELVETCKFIEPQTVYFFLPFMDEVKNVPSNVAIPCNTVGK